MFCNNCHSLLKTKPIGQKLVRFCPKCDGGDIGVGMTRNRESASVLKNEIELPQPRDPRSPVLPPDTELGYFPYEEVREGQRDFIKDVALSFEEGKHLMAYAPTGIGKTVGVLGPAIKKAKETGKKVFFLTSKQSQHHIAIETIRHIKDKFGLDLRAVDVISKQNMCPRDISKEHPVVFNEFCKLEQKTNTCKYYSKHDKTLLRKITDYILHVDELTNLAGNAGVCPHKIALEAAAHADIVICDYNYIFSDISETVLNAMDLTLDDIILIVDEAHNLPDRIRSHLSQDLTMNRLDEALSEVRGKAQLMYFLKHIRTIVGEMLKGAEKGSEMLIDHRPFMDRIEGILKQTLDDNWDLDSFIEELFEIGEKRIVDGAPYSAAMEVGAFLDGFRQTHPGMIRVLSDQDVRKLYFRLLDPSVISGPIFDQINGSVLMSGTLHPARMYADLLGIPKSRALFASYSSPFPQENRPIYIVPDVTTRYKRRSPEMYEKIALYVKTAASLIPGNIAVFFPSYQILGDVRYPLERMNLAKRILVEERQSSKREKEKIIEQLAQLKIFRGGVLLAVMGGSLSEGIDYKDNLLDCVCVVGLPLAPPTLEQKQVVAYYNKKFGMGKGDEYGYLSPALNRVLQAMGRCIRSETDRAVVLLMDDRFQEQRYRKFLPYDLKIRNLTNVKQQIGGFYSELS